MRSGTEQDRADAVKKALVDGGCPDSQFITKGYGPNHWLKKNDSAANKEENRRVEFKVWSNDGKASDFQKGEANWSPPKDAPTMK